MKKVVEIDQKAVKQLHSFSETVQAKFVALFQILERDGTLKEPYGKKVTSDIFELRVKHKGQWRALYAYIKMSKIIILSAFQKKTQKTPLNEIKIAEKRMKTHL